MERNLNWLALLISMIFDRFGLRSCSHLARYMHSVAKRPYVMLDTFSEVAQPEDFAPETTSRKSMTARGGAEAYPCGLIKVRVVAWDCRIYCKEIADGAQCEWAENLRSR